MLRKILLASVAIIVGYIVGARAGFAAGVRDYINNDGEMLERIAIESDKFDYPKDADDAENVRRIVEDAVREAGDRHNRTFQ